MRLSSKLTLISKILMIILCIPISIVIAVETQYAIWAIVLSILLVYLCLFYAWKAADLYKENEIYTFKKIGMVNVSVASSEINKVKLLASNKNTYLWFDTMKGSFLVIAPMWGDGKLALLEIHNKFKTQAL